MTVTDPDCGTCKTITSGEKTWTVVHNFPKALTHYYPLPAIDASSIPIYRGTFINGGTKYRGILNIDLEPRPRLRAHVTREVTLKEGLPEWLESGSVKHEASWVMPDSLSIPAKAIPPPAKTARPPKVDKSGPASWGTFDHLNPIEVGDPAQLDSVTFALFNGWHSYDGFNTCYEGTDRPGRIDLTLGDWQLRIEPRGDIGPDALRKHLRATGASVLTHVGRIRRNDGSPFDAFSALDVLDIIESLAGFALGRVTAIVLPVGYRDGKPTWTRWRCDRVIDPPMGPSPFLDAAHAATQMTELFRSGYRTSQDNPLRWAVFKSALGYHYSAEHNATVNMKVLLPISALQLISYAYLVEELPAGHPKKLTNKQWRSLDTVDQLRNVLDLIGVDLSVPSHLKRLANVRSAITDKALPSPDALDCAIRLRNQAAHPKQKTVGLWSTEEWGETGFATTTMFNLSMLWWLGYDERHLPKTAAHRGYGDSVYVPWHGGP